MKPANFLFIVLTTSTACSSVSPVINQYETANTLGKGGVELMGNYTRYAVSGSGDNAAINNNFGFRAGLGIGNKTDLKVRYEYLKPTPSEYEGSNEAVHYVSIIPKFALQPGKLALLVPISIYTAAQRQNPDDPFEPDNNYQSIAPQIVYTYTNPKRTFDLSPAFRADLLFDNGGAVLYPGINLGAGFSSDLSKWAIRPEVGVLSVGGGLFIGYGVALQLLPAGRKPPMR